MASINPYLTFNGNCEDAFNFYKSVFGGEFPYIGRYKDMPPTADMVLTKADAEKIMHISLPISSATILMGSDCTEGHSQNMIMGNNIAISINVDSRDEADKLFQGLSQGGNVTMPMSDTFWGAYFGMWEDKFGISWMMNYDTNAKKHLDF